MKYSNANIKLKQSMLGEEWGHFTHHSGEVWTRECWSDAEREEIDFERKGEIHGQNASRS